MTLDKMRAGALAATPGPYRIKHSGKLITVVSGDLRVCAVSAVNTDRITNAAHIANPAGRERCALRFESLSNELYDADKHAAAIRKGEALEGEQ